MKAYVSVRYTDDLGRKCEAFFTRKGASLSHITDLSYHDILLLSESNVLGIGEPSEVTSSVDPKMPEYCYGEITGRDKIKGNIRVLARHDDGFNEIEYLVKASMSTRNFVVKTTDWKYWG